ncbi:MAG: hypothetical protein AAGE52_11670 [Myxococcota bacterium]
MEFSFEGSEYGTERSYIRDGAGRWVSFEEVSDGPSEQVRWRYGEDGELTVEVEADGYVETSAVSVREDGVVEATPQEEGSVRRWRVSRDDAGRVVRVDLMNDAEWESAFVCRYDGSRLVERIHVREARTSERSEARSVIGGGTGGDSLPVGGGLGIDLPEETGANTGEVRDWFRYEGEALVARGTSDPQGIAEEAIRQDGGGWRARGTIDGEPLRTTANYSAGCEALLRPACASETMLPPHYFEG